MPEVWMGLGSNLGNRERNIRRALSSIKKKCKILRVSSLYETEPVGYAGQGWFLNCAAKVNTSLKPKELLEFLQSIEKELKREREVRNGPRTIDIDILFYEDRLVKERGLEIPHPRMHGRRFVLEPLSEISPGLIHPVLGKSVKALLSGLKSSKKVKVYKKA